MFYEMPRQKNKHSKDMWPKSTKYIAAKSVSTNEPADIPLISDNILVLGKTGFGKTSLIKKITEAFISDDNAPFTVFLDVKNDFRGFIKPNDKVVCFADSPNSFNTFKWNMIREIRQSSDWEAELESIADMLFLDLAVDARNKFWTEAGKGTLKAYLRTILYCYKNNPSNKAVLDGLKYMSLTELLSHISKYQPNSYILRDYFEYDARRTKEYKPPRKVGDILSFLSTVTQRFIGPFQSADGQDTVQDFVNGLYGKRLHLVYDYSKQASSNVFFRLILRKLTEFKLSQKTVNRSKKFLLVLDEASLLECDFGLVNAALLGRGNNLQIILSTQSLEKLYCIAPQLNCEHNTNALLSGFPTTISFAPGDAETINKLQAMFGNKKKQIINMPLSRYSAPITEIINEPIVTAEDLSSLDIGECYVKIRNTEPECVKIIL